MLTVTATQVAQKTSRILDIVERNREPVLVQRHGVGVAQILPVETGMTISQVLANISGRLSPEQADRWLADLRFFEERV